MEKDIFSRLEEKASAFSRGQKRIAGYIQENREQASFFTAAKIARAVGVSESTVVRFALELGYSGYPEMQKALQEKVLRKLSPGKPEEQLDGISLAFHRDVAALTKTRDTLDRNLLMSAAEMVSRAGRVYVWGSGRMAALAELLKNALLRCRSGVYLLKEYDIKSLCRELLDGEDGDVFLELCSFDDGEDAALRLAEKMGYVTVSFGSEKGDYAFPCDREEGMLPVSLLVTLHAFLGAVGDIRQETMMDRNTRIEGILKQVEESAHEL